jgi:ABC-type glycerol-3-phosphate transport system substrate-binding protein
MTAHHKNILIKIRLRRVLNPMTLAGLLIFLLLASGSLNVFAMGAKSEAGKAPEADQTGTAVSSEPFAEGGPQLKIQFNEAERFYTAGSLLSDSFQVPVPLPSSSGRALSSPLKTIVQAVSLADLLPLILDLWEFSVTDDAGKTHDLLHSWSEDFLFETYIYADGDALNLVHRDITVPRITAVSLKGDRLPDKPLEIWLSWEGTNHLKQILNRFAETYQIPMSVNVIPGIDTKLTAHNRGGMRVPDVVMVQADYLPQLISEKALQPVLWELSPALQKQGLDSFTSSQLYAVPFSSDVQIVCWNPEILTHPYGSTENDLTGTLEMLEKNLSAVSDPFIPAAWNIYSAYWLMPFQLGFGKEALLEEDGSMLVNDDATVEAMNYLLHLIDNGLISALERDGMVSQFIQGRTGMILTGSYALPGFIDLGIPLDIVPYPINQETGAFFSPLIDYKGFAIPKKSRSPIGARRVMQYLTSPQIQAEFSFANYKNPARDDIWELSSLPERINMVLQESIARGTIIPPEPAYNISKDTMWKMIRLILSQQISVEEGLNSAQEIIHNQITRINH